MDRDIRLLVEEGEEFYPASITDAVAHPNTKCSLTDMVDEYNLTTIWPLESGYYDIATAIQVLNENLPENLKKPGVHAEFTNSSGRFESWEYFGANYEFANELGWKKIDSTILSEIEQVVFPVTVNLSVNNTLLQTKVNYNITFTWSVSRKSKDVTSQAKKYFNNEPIDTTGTTLTLNEPSYTSRTYTFSGAYEGLSASASKTLTFVDPCYRGIVDNDWTPSENYIISNFTSAIQASKSYTWSGINLNYQKTCYAYPTYFGKLVSIKDANNFDYINSYTITTLTINGISYYVYVLTNSTTFTGAKQIFS
jgi:hypothetical protein